MPTLCLSQTEKSEHELVEEMEILVMNQSDSFINEIIIDSNLSDNLPDDFISLPMDIDTEQMFPSNICDQVVSGEEGNFLILSDILTIHC